MGHFKIVDVSEEGRAKILSEFVGEDYNRALRTIQPRESGVIIQC